MTVLEILEAVRAKIANGWTQKTFARDINGEIVSPTSSKAVCFCLTGAFRSLGNDCGDWARARIILKSCLSKEYDSLADWNDELERTQADVLNLIDMAIFKIKAGLTGIK